MDQQAIKSEKSELRKQLDALSDARAEIEAAPFYNKEQKINKFITDLEIFLDSLVRELDTLKEGDY